MAEQKVKSVEHMLEQKKHSTFMQYIWEQNVQ